MQARSLRQAQWQALGPLVKTRAFGMTPQRDAFVISESADGIAGIE
jgi:hypothetical protein